MPPDRVASIETFSIRLPRDAEAVRGTAGSPTQLSTGRFDYRWSQTNGALYSVNFEAALVKVTLESGLAGWGEAQAPLAPDVSCLIIDQLLRPAIEGSVFDGSPQRVTALRDRMYSTMRVRGQVGGFMLDAIAGVDLALWDLAGKIRRQPVWELLDPADTKRRIPAYQSGLSGANNEERVEFAREAWACGFRTFKLFHDRTDEELFDLIDRLRSSLGSGLSIAVDALWRLATTTAVEFGRKLDDRNALWLECPLPPELAHEHARLASEIHTPLALGESYRSRWELAPFLERDCVRWLQPDLGRFGISEASALARETGSGIRIVPHISIAMGPQIAAALHFSAALRNVELAEYNPAVFSVANRFLSDPLEMDGPAYRVPSGPGLGAEIDEVALKAVASRPVVRPVTDGPDVPADKAARDRGVCST